MPAASNALVSLQDAIYIFSEPGLIPNDQSSRDGTGRNRSVDRSRSPGERSPSQGFSLMKFIIFPSQVLIENPSKIETKTESGKKTDF